MALKTFFASGLAIFSYLDIRYQNSLIFISLLENELNILTCSRGFLSCLQLGSFDAKNTDAKSICTMVTCAGGTCAGDICIEGICIRDFYIKST